MCVIYTVRAYKICEEKSQLWGSVQTTDRKPRRGRASVPPEGGVFVSRAFFNEGPFWFMSLWYAWCLVLFFTQSSMTTVSDLASVLAVFVLCVRECEHDKLSLPPPSTNFCTKWMWKSSRCTRTLWTYYCSMWLQCSCEMMKGSTALLLWQTGLVVRNPRRRQCSCLSLTSLTGSGSSSLVFCYETLIYDILYHVHKSVRSASLLLLLVLNNKALNVHLWISFEQFLYSDSIFFFFSSS